MAMHNAHDQMKSFRRLTLINGHRGTRRNAGDEAVHYNGPYLPDNAATSGSDKATFFYCLLPYIDSSNCTKPFPPTILWRTARMTGELIGTDTPKAYHARGPGTIQRNRLVLAPHHASRRPSVQARIDQLRGERAGVWPARYLRPVDFLARSPGEISAAARALRRLPTAPPTRWRSSKNRWSRATLNSRIETGG